jgi:hypothetical protein
MLIYGWTKNYNPCKIRAVPLPVTSQNRKLFEKQKEKHNGDLNHQGYSEDL